MQPEEKALLDANVRRVVGLSALRRLRRHVDAWEEDQRQQAAFAKYIMLAFGVSAVTVALFCLISPEVVIAMLRSLVVFVR